MICTPSPLQTTDTSPNTMPGFHKHVLHGCAPRPLAAYLKALGILRILAEQIDPQVRGYWHNDSFVLLTKLSKQQLVDFFLHDWRPSPFVSPWNKGSGLLDEEDKGVTPIEQSQAPRFEDFRAGIKMAKQTARPMTEAVLAEQSIKNEATQIKNIREREALRKDDDYKQRLNEAARLGKRLKDQLQSECQRQWRGPALRWLRAAMILNEHGEAVFPSILGTGGNDGRLDFTNNAMQRLGDLFDLSSDTGAPKPGVDTLLQSALFGDPVTGLIKGAIGQYSPASVGGANSTSQKALGDSRLNPWDLPLLLEGTLLFIGGTSRRLGGASSARTVAPFSARAWTAGYASASSEETSFRGEQWMPLWTRPWTASEVAALLTEGRCQLGSRPTDSTMDVARAVARLGVARGVTAFERYGYLERNGQANLAVPLGRWTVKAEPHTPLLDDLEAGGWWTKIRIAATDKLAPGSLVSLERRLGDSIMEALAHGDESARWQTVLLTLAELEAQLIVSGSFTADKKLAPIPKLSPDWLKAINDGSPELSLAMALAGAATEHTATYRPINQVRGHWLPLDKFGNFQRGETDLPDDPDVVMTGRDPESDLIALLQRRIIGATGTKAARILPIQARTGTGTNPETIMGLLGGAIDLNRTYWLARGLAALDWPNFKPWEHGINIIRPNLTVDPVWAALKLCHLPGPLDDQPHIPVDPAILRSLTTGDAPGAFALVIRRLRSAGIMVPFRAVALTPSMARRFAVSLAFPITANETRRLVNQLNPPINQELSVQEVHDVH